ncbi:lysophospholipid acyltransferase 5 [Microplitis mediator]|uniref:lysophospholipid acyltransferase 5 n=1 Tax=Microplitis mediator TaxID=375433 RepID=UPI002554A23D|nr:lysophospholipid acyltransferase 5 [Microplitis mediator]
MSVVIENEAGLLQVFAGMLGCSIPALRLLISIFLGLPFAYIHRKYFIRQSPELQHIFFIVCGIFLGSWNFGWNVGHSALALSATYLILLIFGGSSVSIVLSFLFNMSYLSYGYWSTSTDDYDIKWTMPHCVLTLRLIGVAFNLSDGCQDESKLSAYQKKESLKKVPSFLELAAFVYFPGSFLVGPQFTLKRYQNYVSGLFVKGSGNGWPDHMVAGAKRTVQGLGYLFMYQLGIYYMSDQYMMEKFPGHNYFSRLLLVGLWGRIHLYKYISCWLLSEGVCMTFGISYNGKDENGSTKWDGCKNVDLIRFENATQFNHYIQSFNMNTNEWCAEYIYKRLKFVGSRFASQFLTLLFLAIWHGFHSGYYVTFFNEFIIMYFEKDVASALVKNDRLQAALKNPLAKIPVWIVLKLYTLIFMGYATAPFLLLSYTRYIKIYTSVYFTGHFIFLSYPIVAPFIKPMLRGTKKVRAD